MSQATDRVVGRGRALSTPAKDFTLQDQWGHSFQLYSALEKGPILLVFYPADFTLVCTKQLCNYQDHLTEFSKFGVQVVGLSKNTPESHAAFAKKYRFNFPLLSDSDHQVAKTYGCRSLLMFGGVSRAVAIVNQARELIYHYVEPTVVTRRKASQLLGVIESLKEAGRL